MSPFSRREFLAGAGALAAGTLLCEGHRLTAADAPPRIRKGTDLITLGRSGLKSTVLGLGTGTRGGNEQRDLGQTEFVKLARYAFDRGLRYIDTADSYQIHLFVRFALQGLPREQIFLQTKTFAKHPEVAKADIERFRRELKVDYLDSSLMHCQTTSKWPTDMRPVMDVLQEAKEKKKVRAVGISQHGWDPLAASVDVDWIDIQLVRINPFGMKMDGKPEDVAPLLKKMHDQGRGVIGMKIFGEGDCKTAEQRLAALKYVLGLGSVDCFTIGFSSPAQIDETLSLIEQATA